MMEAERKCLLTPGLVCRSELAAFCSGKDGLVFLGLRGERVPHFILDVALELSGDAAPCALPIVVACACAARVGIIASAPATFS